MPYKNAQYPYKHVGIVRDVLVDKLKVAADCPEIDAAVRDIRALVSDVFDQIKDDLPLPESGEGKLTYGDKDPGMSLIDKGLAELTAALQNLANDPHLYETFRDRGYGDWLTQCLKDKTDFISVLKKVGSDIDSRENNPKEKFDVYRLLGLVILGARIAFAQIGRGEITSAIVEKQHGVVKEISKERAGEIGVGVPGVNANSRWLYANVIANWLRLFGIMTPITYEELYERDLANFMKPGPETALGRNLILFTDPKTNEPLLKDKIVMDLGAGVGNDAVGYVTKGGAKHVVAVDVSKTACDGLRRRLSSSPTRLPVSIVPFGMKQRMKNLAEKKRKNEGPHADMPGYPDVITSNSVFHRIDETGLTELGCDCLAVLPDGGIFAFAVKELTGTLFKSGIPLYVNGDDIRINYGLDGQIRFARRMETYKKLFQESRELSIIEQNPGAKKHSLCVFELLRAATEPVSDYEHDGEKQEFYYFIFRKKTVDTFATLAEAEEAQRKLPSNRRET